MSVRGGALVAAGILVLALTGCATAGPGASPSGVPAGEMDIQAGWLDGGRMIALVTPVSVTCAPIVSEVEVSAEGVLQVMIEDAEGVPCTDDDAPRVVAVSLPEGIDPARTLTVRATYGVDSWGETALDVYAGDPVEEFTPSAGWVGDGLFAILTWGSSTCVPAIESAEPSGSDAVTVTFATPAADRACTMDMAPRVVLASVNGVDGGASVMLTLTGGSDFPEPVTVPIAG